MSKSNKRRGCFRMFGRARERIVTEPLKCVSAQLAHDCMSISQNVSSFNNQHRGIIFAQLNSQTNCCSTRQIFTEITFAQSKQERQWWWNQQHHCCTFSKRISFESFLSAVLRRIQLLTVICQKCWWTVPHRHAGFVHVTHIRDERIFAKQDVFLLKIELKILPAWLMQPVNNCPRSKWKSAEICCFCWILVGKVHCVGKIYEISKKLHSFIASRIFHNAMGKLSNNHEAIAYTCMRCIERFGLFSVVRNGWSFGEIFWYASGMKVSN